MTEVDLLRLTRLAGWAEIIRKALVDARDEISELRSEVERLKHQGESAITWDGTGKKSGW